MFVFDGVLQDFRRRRVIGMVRARLTTVTTDVQTDLGVFHRASSAMGSLSVQTATMRRNAATKSVPTIARVTVNERRLVHAVGRVASVNALTHATTERAWVTWFIHYSILNSTALIYTCNSSYLCSRIIHNKLIRR